MAHLLSSRWTFIVKYVYPILWIGGFGTLTLLLFIAPELFLSRSGDPPPTWIDNLAVVAWIVVSILIVATTMPLKRVFLDGNRLVVSNFRRDARIPLSDIAMVTQNRWLKTRPVTIAFRNRTPFGRQVQFMPPARMNWRFWREDPIVDELRLLSVPQESPPHYVNTSPSLSVRTGHATASIAPTRSPDSHLG